MSEYFLSVSEAKDFIANNLIAVGVPKSDAVIVANLMIQSDLAGADDPAVRGRSLPRPGRGGASDAIHRQQGEWRTI